VISIVSCSDSKVSSEKLQTVSFEFIELYFADDYQIDSFDFINDDLIWVGIKEHFDTKFAPYMTADYLLELSEKYPNLPYFTWILNSYSFDYSIVIEDIRVILPDEVSQTTNTVEIVLDISYDEMINENISFTIIYNNKMKITSFT
jgi:hypothetical protein